MKKIYTSDNVKKNLTILQRRYSNMYNREFSVKEIIYAFNKLPGRYQDLLLKFNKDENDKATLIKAYNILKKELMNLKEVPDDIKINIKNINQEETAKNTGFTIEDVESDSGDKWVRPKVKEKREVKDFNASNKIVITKKIKEKEEKKEEVKKVEPIKEEPKIITPKVEPVVEEKEEIVEEKEEVIIPVKNKSKHEILMALNKRVQLVVLEEYLKERKKIDMESIIENMDMDDDEKLILLVKFENNSVKTNETVSKELGIKVDYIDGVVTKFFENSIKQSNKKIYKLERE